MSNLTTGAAPQPLGLGGRKLLRPVANAASLFQGAMLAELNGQIVTGSTAGAGPCVGINEDQGNVVGASDGSTRVTVWTDRVFIISAGVNAPTDTTPLFSTLFMEDDNHVGILPVLAGVQLKEAGTFMGIEDDGSVRVLVSPSSAWFTGADSSVGSGGSTLYKARAVVTTLHAYTGSGTGTLTSTANGAFGTQDDVATLAIGDVVFIPEGRTNISAAKDAGPYVLSVLGNSSPGAAWVLTRPPWWQTGEGMVNSQAIEIQEGTVFGGNSFKVFAGKGKVIDTDDPVFWPKNFMKTVILAAGTYTLGFGGGGEDLMLRSTTQSMVQATVNTPAGTLGTNKLSAPVASRVAGAIGVGVVVVNSMNDNAATSGETSTVDVLVTNW